MSSVDVNLPIAAGSERSAMQGFKIVLLLMMVVGFGHFNRVGISVVGGERIIPHHGVSETRMGMVYSAFLITYTLSMIPGGLFIDRFGPRRALALLLFGSSFFVAMTGLVGLVTSDSYSLWIGLLIVRSLMGISNAPLHPASAATVYQYAPPAARSLINGLVTFAACAGVAATYYAMGGLIEALDWPYALLVMSGITFCAAIVWTMGTRDLAHISRPVPNAVDGTNPVPVSGFWSVFRNRSIIFITLSYVALGYFQYLFFYWIDYYFKKVDTQSDAIAHRNSTLIILAMGFGMIFGGRISDRLPLSLSPSMRRRIVPLVGMFASGLAFEVGVLSSDSKTMFAAFLVSAALLGACEASFWTTVNELAGSFGGTAGGFMNCGGNAGGTLSPTVTPWLSAIFAEHFGESTGWRLSLAVAGIVSIIGALMWLGVKMPDDDYGEIRPS